MSATEKVPRDLQSLLRRGLDDRLTVEDFSSEAFLPSGENYGSTILSIHAIIRRYPGAEKEDLHAVAKMALSTEFLENLIDISVIFKKEIFMYENIVPAYNRLEIESGIPKEETFDILPKLYGSRLSLSPDVDFDEGATILLENLKQRGYYCGDRKVGVDIEHARLTMKRAARFHALGIAMKRKKPEEFEVMKHRANSVEINVSNFSRMMETMMEKLRNDPEIGQYYDRCTAVFGQSFSKFWQTPENNPWTTIVHADLWMNNIMFHRDESGRVDDVKFIDFQTYFVLSALRDMVLFLFTSVEPDALEANVDALIDLYHETFLSTLKRVGCDATPFSRSEFDAELLADAAMEFPHCAFMMRIMTFDRDEDGSAEIENLISSDGSEEYKKRSRNLVKYFVKRNWI